MSKKSLLLSISLVLTFLFLISLIPANAHCGACPGDNVKQEVHKHEHKAEVKIDKKVEACGTSTCDVKKVETKACCGSEACKTKKSVIKHENLNPSQLKKIIDGKKEVIILDARSGKFDTGERIPGAFALNATSTPEEIEKVVKSKDAEIITYCSNTKCPASGKLYNHLKDLGYTNLKEMPEGIKGWKDSGYEVNKVK